jgi:hypothetical protein
MNTVLLLALLFVGGHVNTVRSASPRRFGSEFTPLLFVEFPPESSEPLQFIVGSSVWLHWSLACIESHPCPTVVELVILNDDAPLTPALRIASASSRPGALLWNISADFRPGRYRLRVADAETASLIAPAMSAPFFVNAFSPMSNAVSIRAQDGPAVCCTGNGSAIYVLDVDAMMAAPDGVAARVYSINGKFQGPTLSCTLGDTISVLVKNSLSTEEMTIHWHGALQVG